MKKIYTLVVLSLFVTVSAFSQGAANYLFTTSTGNALDPMTTPTTLCGPSIDDTGQPSISIGFPFTFADSTYTEIGITPDGFAVLKATPFTTSNDFSNSITGPVTANFAMLFPWWDDVATGTTGSVTTTLVGAAPNQIRVINWFVTMPRLTSGPATVNFQLWLYETTNVIEFRYGDVVPSGTTTSASVGIMNNIGGLTYQSISVNSHTASFTVANNNNTNYNTNISGTGRLYRFTPSTCNGVAGAASSVLSNDSAIVSWTAGTGTNWLVEYGPTGFVKGTGTVVAVSNPTDTLSGLMTETSYQWYVSSFCGIGDTSNWNGPNAFTTLPTCPAPSAFSASNVSFTTVDLAWTTGGATTWHIEYGSVGFAPGTGTGTFISTTNNPETLTGLSSATQYQVYVRDYCGPADSSQWVGPVSFTTAIAPITCAPGNGNASVLYTESFETDVTIGPGGSNGNVGPWTQVRSSDPDWTWDGAGGTTSSGTGPNSAYDGSGFVYLETSSGSVGQSDTLTSPMYDLSSVNSPARVRFFYHMFGPQIGTMIFEYSGDGGLTWTTGWSLTGAQQPVQAAPWFEAAIDVSSAVGSSNFMIRYIGVGNGTFLGDMAIDFIQIEACVSCAAPTNLTANVLNLDSTLLYFDAANGSDSTIIEYGPAGFTLGTGTIFSTVEDSVYLLGLAPNTGYEVYIASDCSISNGDSSVVLGPVSFLTPCAPVFAAPLCENFDSWNPGAFGPGINTCWSSFKTSIPRWEVESTGVQNSFDTGPLADASGSGNYVFLECSGGTLGNADTLTSPLIDLSSLTVPMFTYEYHMYGVNMGNLDVYVQDVNTGVSTIVSSFSGQQQTGENQPWRKATIYLTSFVGDTVILKFVGARGNGFESDISLDEVCIQEAPSCPDPFALSLDSIGSQDAYLSWDVPFGTPNYEVEAVLAGQNQGTGIVVSTVDTFAVVTGLMPDTDYDFYVRALCSASDSSNWVFVGGGITLHLNEIGVTAISSPAGGCGVSATPITITVENFGTANLLYVPIVVQLTGDITDVYTLVLDTLNGGSVVTLTLDSLNTLSGGVVDFVAFTNLASDEDTSNDTVAVTLSFGAIPMAPMLVDAEICQGENAVLTSTSTGVLSWFASDTSSVAFFQGDTLVLTAPNDTVFYVSQQEAGSGTATLDMFDSFGDGWNGASLVVSINGNPVSGSPFSAVGSGTTATFTVSNGDTLSLVMNSGSFDSEISYTLTGPDGAVIFNAPSPIAIGPVFTGVVNVLGCPSDLSMVSVMVNPNYLDTVVMTACDSMMVAGANQTVSGFYTDSLTSMSGCDSVVVYDLTINASNEESVSFTICDGSSFTLPDGTVVNTPGLYLTTITNAAGCDSLVKTDLSVVASYSVVQNLQICADDSLVVGASVYDSTGTYTDTLVSVGGCDSIVTSNLVVYPTVDVTLGGVSTVCENAAVIDLTLDPIGGVLSGPGVTGTSFDAAAAGIGSHVLVYTFVGPNGCSATASLNVEVVVCTGIDNIEGIETLSIYPNPFVNELNIMFDDAIAGELNIKLFDVTGRVLMTQDVNTSVGVNTISLDVPADIAAGVSIIQIERDGAIYSTTLIKK